MKSIKHKNRIYNKFGEKISFRLMNFLDRESIQTIRNLADLTYESILEPVDAKTLREFHEFRSKVLSRFLSFAFNDMPQLRLSQTKFI